MSGGQLVFEDAASTAEACSQHILEILKRTLAQNEYATLALSGGSTPKMLFNRMAAANFSWDGVHLFWVDERCVAPNDARSNYRLALETLVTPAKILRHQVHRVPAELEPAAAAVRYSDEIRGFFRLQPGELPRFDVIQRGMGPDAHTASLFPSEPLIDDRQKIAAAVYVEKLSEWRVTLAPGALLAARNTVVLVTGEDKAAAVHSVFTEPFDPKRYPAQLGLQGEQPMTWFLDQAAVKLLAG